MGQFRLWGAVGIIVLILAALFYTDLKAYERGVVKTEAKYAKMRENAHSVNTGVRNDVVRKTDKEIEKAMDKWYRD